MSLKIKKIKNARWPNLETLIMIEQTIFSLKGPKSRREIWLKLPKKVMWQTFLTALDYLEKTLRTQREAGKIVFKSAIQEELVNEKIKLSEAPSYVY